MFAALKIPDRSRVNSIAAQWDGREEELRELARSGQLVCPGCEQLLWLRTGDVRRRHFAHRNLSECRLGKQSAEVLEAKAQIFTWLESRFPGNVQIDLELDSTGHGKVADLVVDLEGGERFIYCIFDRQIRDRDGYPKPPENKTGRIHYIHTESTLVHGPGGGIVLSASQRHFISYSEFDLALEKPRLGHLHFFLGSESQLLIYRGLRCVHGPGLHEWEELREGPLDAATVCPESGEFIFSEDMEAREERQRNLTQTAHSNPVTRTGRRSTWREPEPTGVSKAAEYANFLNRPLRCEDCGAETRKWSSANPSEGTCVCKECSHKRWLGQSETRTENRS
jgi:hypothetical protein